MRDASTSPTYHGLLLLLLVRLTKHEPLTEHRPVVRTSQHMCAAQENFDIAASPSWSWPHALGEREVGRGGSFASAAWPRAGAARKLGPGGPRTHHLCHRSLGIDPARLTGRPWSMRASETTAHVRVSTALRLRDPARPREELASFSSCARTCCPEESGVGRPNAGVEAVGLARRTWRLLGVLPVLLGAAISHFGHGASVAICFCAHAFTAKPGFCNYFLRLNETDATGRRKSGTIRRKNRNLAPAVASPVARVAGALLLPPPSFAHPPPPPSSPPLLICLAATIVAAMLIHHHPRRLRPHSPPHHHLPACRPPLGRRNRNRCRNRNYLWPPCRLRRLSHFRSEPILFGAPPNPGSSAGSETLGRSGSGATGPG